MTDQILDWLTLYGVPALFTILLIASAGVPFPVTLLLIVAGSFTKQGELNFWPVILAGSAGAVAGDQIGYAIGRWGGRRLVKRITNRFGGEGQVARAEKFVRRWDSAGIFFSRWLITPLGPWINLTSGIVSYPWLRFAFWDVLGEVLWVVLYVLLGYSFSDRVQDIAKLMGNLSWIIIGLIAAALTGWQLISYLRSINQEESQHSKER